MKADKPIYKLIKEDVQRVAIQEIDRKLTQLEIKQIEDSLAENIDWYSAIAESIKQNLGDEFHRNN